VSNRDDSTPAPSSTSDPAPSSEAAPVEPPDEPPAAAASAEPTAAGTPAPPPGTEQGPGDREQNANAQPSAAANRSGPIAIGSLLAGRRGRIIAVGAAGLAVFFAVMLIFSWLNSRHYYLVCGAEQVTAERGSRFPWGQTRLSGPQWRPIRLPASSRCSESRFSSEAELAAAITAVLMRETSAILAGKPTPEQLEQAAAQLEQALLLTRAVPGQRAEIGHLAGDVEYHRAQIEVRTASNALDRAAAGFAAAAAKQPRFAGDAQPWGTYVSSLAEQLRARISGDTKAAAPRPESYSTRPAANDARQADPLFGPPLPPDFEPPAAQPAPVPPAASSPAPPPAPDASLPSGGVLL
jgi:hypothetical protein